MLHRSVRKLAQSELRRRVASPQMRPESTLNRTTYGFKLPEWKKVQPHIEDLSDHERERLAKYASLRDRGERRSPIPRAIIAAGEDGPRILHEILRHGPDIARAIVAAKGEEAYAVKAILNREGEYGPNTRQAILKSGKRAPDIARAIVVHGLDVEVASAILRAGAGAPDAAHAIAVHGQPAARAILRAGAHARKVARIYAQNSDVASAEKEAAKYL